jgi:hypothetical protein
MQKELLTFHSKKKMYPNVTAPPPPKGEGEMLTDQFCLFFIILNNRFFNRRQTFQAC